MLARILTELGLLGSVISVGFFLGKIPVEKLMTSRFCLSEIVPGTENYGRTKFIDLCSHCKQLFAPVLNGN